ncbi:MAG TPA: hypothetical protein VMM85_03310 [Methylomirabilota bacterium]|nr:hypothetical protein [Methylomirabilota bacterium]
MTRILLLIGSVLWLLAALAGLVLAALGADAIRASIPDLAIDADALRGAVVAMATGLASLGLMHLTVLLGLRWHRRWALPAGILMSAVLAATLLALGVSSAVGLVSPWGLVGAIGAVLVAMAYGALALGLVQQLRGGSVD